MEKNIHAQRLRVQSRKESRAETNVPRFGTYFKIYGPSITLFNIDHGHSAFSFPRSAVFHELKHSVHIMLMLGSVNPKNAIVLHNNRQRLTMNRAWSAPHRAALTDLPPLTLQVSMSSAPSLYGPRTSSTRMPRSLCIRGRPGGTAKEARKDDSYL